MLIPKPQISREISRHAFSVKGPYFQLEFLEIMVSANLSSTSPRECLQAANRGGQRREPVVEYNQRRERTEAAAGLFMLFMQ